MEYENYEFEEEKKLSIKQFLLVCVGINKKARIRFGIIAGAIFLITTLLVLLLYNPNRGEYTATWTYDVYTLTDNETVDSTNELTGAVVKKKTISYLDGTTFKVKDLYSLNHLYEIVDSNPNLAGIDAYKLYNKDAISIVMKAPETSNDDYTFTINVQQSYFKSKDQAREFVKAIAETPVEITKSLIDEIDNTRYLKVFKYYSSTYQEKIEALKNQAASILSNYESLMAKYGDRRLSSKFIIGDFISDYYHSAESLIQSQNLDALQIEVAKKHYVYKYTQYLPVLESKKNELTVTLGIVDNKITALKNEGLHNETLSELLIQKEDLQNEISIVEDFISDGATVDTSAFDDRLEDIYQKLSSITTSLTDVQKEVYSERQYVYYDNNNVVDERGSLGVALTAILALVLGVAVAVMTNLFMDYSKYKKQIQEENEEKSQDNETKEKTV